MTDFEPRGVIPAAILPFDNGLGIDADAFASHLCDLAAVDGVAAITVNGHASEVSSCAADEQRRVLDIALEAVGDSVPLVAGVYADGSLEAARLARMSAAAGASALLVFPPNVYLFGQKADMVLAHFGHIAEATDLPLIAFQYPPAWGHAYPLDTLLTLAEQVPTLRAIKSFTGDVQAYEREVRSLHALPSPVNVLSTHSAWLLSALVQGADGLLSGAGSVVADLHVMLFDAVQAGDLHRAQRVSERLHPISEAFYRAPYVDMHNRMKEALVLLGRIPSATVRAPLTKLSTDEVEAIRIALDAAGVTRGGAAAEAA